MLIEVQEVLALGISQCFHPVKMEEVFLAQFMPTWLQEHMTSPCLVFYFLFVCLHVKDQVQDSVSFLME